MVRRLIIASALGAVLPGLARADNFELPVFKAGDHGYGFHLGMALPTETNGFSDRAGRGGAFSLRLTRFLNSWVAYGAELGTEMHLKHKTASSPGGSISDASFDAQALHLTLFGRANLFLERFWTPYFIAGGGLNRLSVKGSAPSPVCWPVAQACANTVAGSSTGIELDGGGGIEFFFLRGMTLSIEGRFREHRVDGKKLGASAESISATLGTTFWF